MERKGEISFVAKIILAIIGGIIILLIAALLFAGSSQAAADTLCKWSCSWEDRSDVLNMRVLDSYCNMVLFEDEDGIYPDEWDNCKESFKEQKDGAKRCLAEQVAKLMKACWAKRGSGEKDCDDLGCYEIKINQPYNDSYTNVEVDKEFLWEVMYTTLVNEEDYKSYSDYLDSFVVEGTIKPGDTWCIKFVNDVDVFPESISTDRILVTKDLNECER